MRASRFADLDGAPLYDRESPARRIGVIVSFLFLTSLGTVATFTSARAGPEQADTPTAIAVGPSATAR